MYFKFLLLTTCVALVSAKVAVRSADVENAAATQAPKKAATSDGNALATQIETPKDEEAIVKAPQFQAYKSQKPSRINSKQTTFLTKKNKNDNNKHNKHSTNNTNNIKKASGSNQTKPVRKQKPNSKRTSNPNKKNRNKVGQKDNKRVNKPHNKRPNNEAGSGNKINTSAEKSTTNKGKITEAQQHNKKTTP